MNQRRALTALDIAALTIATIGAINWGLSAVNFNLVRRLFGRGSLLERATYAVVGLAGLDLAWLTARYITGGYMTPPPQMPETRRLARQVGEQAERVGEQVRHGTEQAGQEIRQTGEEFQRGTYQVPPMRP